MKNLFKRFRTDILGISYFAGGLFLLLILASYNPQDPSLNSSANFRVVTNWGGYIGSFISDILYQGFGLASWLIFIGFINASIKAFRGGEITLQSINFSWGIVLFLVAMTLLGLYFPMPSLFEHKIYLGGVIGLVLSKALVTMLNFIGASLLLWTLVVILLVFYSEKTLIEIVDSIKKISRMFLSIVDLPALKSKSVALAPNGPNILEASGVVPNEEPNQLMSLEERASEPKEKRRFILKAKPPRKVENWDMPKLSLLNDPPVSRTKIDKEELRRKAEILTEKLRKFDVTGEVVAVKPGPAVTMFEFRPSADVKLSSITSMENDLAIALSAESLRIIAPIPGRDVVGIEASNSSRETVYLKDILAEELFWNEDMRLPLCLGRQTNGDPKVVDLAKMPHLLVAGSTGSGKSVFTVGSITGLLFRHSPKTLRLILIDPKQVDLAAFSSVPHLLMPPIVEAFKAVAALRWAVKEMDKRFKSMGKFGARKIDDFNKIVGAFSSEQIAEYEKSNEDFENLNKKNQKFYFRQVPHIVIVVEEFGDLMQLDAKNVEAAVVRLAQLARAAGIHLILCMQSPRKEVVTGLIKTNIPGRISFKVASKMDSRIILDEMGAERLLARGDMLFREPGSDKPMRNHGPWLSDAEISGVAKFWSDQAEPEFDALAMKALDMGTQQGAEPGQDHAEPNDDADHDEMYDQIVEFVASVKEVSASLLQRRFKLGYPRAARLIEILEKEGVVGASKGSKPRQVLINSFKE